MVMAITRPVVASGRGIRVSGRGVGDGRAGRSAARTWRARRVGGNDRHMGASGTGGACRVSCRPRAPCRLRARIPSQGSAMGRASEMGC